MKYCQVFHVSFPVMKLVGFMDFYCPGSLALCLALFQHCALFSSSSEPLGSPKSSSFTHSLDFSSFHKTPCALIPASSGFSDAHGLHHGLTLVVLPQGRLPFTLLLHSIWEYTLDFVRRASNRRQYGMFPSLLAERHDII